MTFSRPNQHTHLLVIVNTLLVIVKGVNRPKNCKQNFSPKKTTVIIFPPLSQSFNPLIHNSFLSPIIVHIFSKSLDTFLTLIKFILPPPPPINCCFVYTCSPLFIWIVENIPNNKHLIICK